MFFFRRAIEASQSSLLFSRSRNELIETKCAGLHTHTHNTERRRQTKKLSSFFLMMMFVHYVTNKYTKRDIRGIKPLLRFIIHIYMLFRPLKIYYGLKRSLNTYSDSVMSMIHRQMTIIYFCRQNVLN